MHQDQHTILQGLVEHGYAGIDEHSKVRHQLDRIKTNELDTAKGQIWASPRLQTHFDECVTLFQDFINNKKIATSHTVTIAALSLKCECKEEDAGEVQPDMSVEDQYYTGKKCSQLSRVKKYGLKLKCQKHGHKPQKNKKKTKPLDNKSVNPTYKHVIKALTKVLKQSRIGEESSTEEDASDKEPTPKKNCTNKELQHKK